jgi:hypothetical protein
MEWLIGGVIEIVPSFMMECAVCNVPDREFRSPDNYPNCLSVLGVFSPTAARPFHGLTGPAPPAA